MLPEQHQEAEKSKARNIIQMSYHMWHIEFTAHARKIFGTQPNYDCNPPLVTEKVISRVSLTTS